MGWSKDTFADMYAPQLPKTVNHICFLLISTPLTCHLQAILGAHDYKVSEAYDNAWTRVRVPEAFLDLVYPQAEGIVTEIEGTRLIRPGHSMQLTYFPLR